ncbi:MAG: SDR family oxidoreductase [Chloroflexi bacterium]|nr:SDR family oxidoreductase [Chloroflexota bacterium]
MFNLKSADNTEIIRWVNTLGAHGLNQLSVLTTQGRDIEEMWKRRDAMSPIGRQGEGWDTANAATFLNSDEAKYITGTTLIVDGGISQTIRSW